MEHEVFFDVVLDANKVPVFTGTSEQVIEWLIAGSEDWRAQENIQVHSGRTLQMKSIDDYLKDFDRSQN